MKRSATLFAVVLVALLVGATAAQAVTRTITTRCVSGNIRATYLVDSTSWTTPTPCSYQTWDPGSGKFVPHNRPETDVTGADQAAQHRWPTCFRVRWNTQYGGNGTYFHDYQISC